MPPLPALDPSALQLFVFGPGVGELVLVRAPPDDWMVVDGATSVGTVLGPRIASHYGFRPRVIVLTHPHMDHALGVAEVVEDATSGSPDTWPKIGMVAPPSAGTTGGGLADLQRYYEGGRAAAAVNAILDRWARRPECRWTMEPGSETPLGDASVRVVGPSSRARQRALQAYQKKKRFDENTVAAALLVSWRKRRLLLGSDLVEKPGKGWSEALRIEQELGTHDGFKVAHHGSLKAMHDDVLSTTGQPTWIITPFASSDLPRFQHGQGVARLLSAVSEIRVTALPHGHNGATGAPIVKRRKTIVQALSSAARFDQPSSGFPERFVAVTFAADDSPPVITHGEGSVRVLR